MKISPEVARLRAKKGAEKLHRPTADTSALDAELKAAKLADRLYKVIEDIADENPYDEWADAVCASLPPMTPEQIRAAALVFSRIDQRRATNGGAADVA